MSQMDNKIKIFDIELDNLGAKDSMRRVVQYMEGGTISTVEVVTLEMLMQGQDSPDWKSQVEAMDLLIPGDIEILTATGREEKALVRDLENKVFLKLFFKYLQRKRKKVFLLAAQEEELVKLGDALQPYKGGLVIAGQAILPEEGARIENVINEINGVEPDCVLSALPCPWQETFISESRALLNARVWLGLGPLLQKDTETKTTGKIRYFFLRRLFRYLVGQQQNQ